MFNVSFYQKVVLWSLQLTNFLYLLLPNFIVVPCEKMQIQKSSGKIRRQITQVFKIKKDWESGFYEGVPVHR